MSTDTEHAVERSAWTIAGLDDPEPARGRPVDDGALEAALSIIGEHPDIEHLAELDLGDEELAGHTREQLALRWLLRRARDFTFEQALAVFRRLPWERTFAGRVVTHPEADVATWREVAELHDGLHIRCALASMPGAVGDRALREALLESGAESTLAHRVLGFADSGELRRQFTRIARDEPSLAWKLLRTDAYDLRRRLTGREVAPLLETEESAARRQELILMIGDMEGLDWAPGDEDRPAPHEERTVDRERLRRSRDHPAEPLTGDQWAVASGPIEYFVHLGPGATCYCSDDVYRPDTYCKHLLAALKAARDPRLEGRRVRGGDRRR